MDITRLGKIYAKSIMDLALERGSLEEVKTDMETILQTFDSSRELKILSKSPVVNSDKKNAIFKEVFKGQISELTAQFIEIITRKGREASLESIAHSYIDLYRQNKQIEVARIVTAVPLTDDKRTLLREQLESITGKKIELEEKTDPSLIGGIKLRVGDRQYDGSIARQLQTLKRQFHKNFYVPEF